jgi:hypothetical protein
MRSVKSEDCRNVRNLAPYVEQSFQEVNTFLLRIVAERATQERPVDIKFHNALFE